MGGALGAALGGRRGRLAGAALAALRPARDVLERQVAVELRELERLI